MNIIKISSQRHIDQDIVEAKIEDQDFEVQVSPVFEIDGQQYQVVMDGHHSLAAAKQVGVEPVWYEQDASDNDNVALIEQGEIDMFMELAHVDSDWYDIESEEDVW